MKGLRRAFWLHLLLAAGSLSAGFMLRGLWIAAPGILLLALLWALGQRSLIQQALGQSGASRALAADVGPWKAQRRRVPLRQALRSVGGLVFLLFTAAALLGMQVGAPAWSGLLGITGALGAWDLDHFLRRLAGAGDARPLERLARAHLRHLLAVEGLGAGAGLLAISVRLRLPFWWEALFVVLVVVGLGQVIRTIRAQVGDEPPGGASAEE